MALFEYVAKDQKGKTLKGAFEAADRSDALERLRNEDLIVVSIEETKVKAKAPLVTKKVGSRDLVVFSRQLATMVDAGIPILMALDILVKQTEKPKFKEVLTKVRDDVEVGVSLSNAFLKHHKIFSSLYVSMIKAGESSGMLADILDRLATYLEKSDSLQRKIQSALVYPALVTTMAFIITAVLLIRVIPVFKNIFASFGAALPTPTLVLIAISDFVRQSFLVIIAIVVGIVYGIYRYTRTEKGRLRFDRFLLMLPIFGTLFTKVAISKFTRTLATLVKSGVPILSCLEVIAKTCGNKVFENAIDGVRFGVREGESIATPLEKSGVFPPMAVKMISVGEQTGELEKMLGKISDFYDDEVDTAISGLTSMIEPLIIAFLGIVIGGIVICMFLPIFTISTIIG